MADRSCGLSFFFDVNLIVDIKIDTFISIRPMNTKFGKHAHLAELTQMKLIKQVLVLVTSKEHYISTTRVPMVTILGRIVTYLIDSCS